ncbi:exodeoxyribonuclease VII small subunit [Megasphaera paucivorans]|uniref:Exodeoxyribonuclease 7 small subunit n=1 Tax=Megasphaera paucivorans TaxID=349095 RepID=A0A1G9T139_9FIRM|nr:exodeoxyribonuclease VII small subunit [Megasphaera paucivorans]SDM41327.1 Exodeoxyribonuclease VII small subunit [Megasphaera paucivorans]
MAKGIDKLKNFENNYEQLEQLVKALETPNLTLKESLDLFEKAVKVSQECESALEYAKQRVEALMAVHVDAQKEENNSANGVTEEGTLDL